MVKNPDAVFRETTGTLLIDSNFNSDIFVVKPSIKLWNNVRGLLKETGADISKSFCLDCYSPKCCIILILNKLQNCLHRQNFRERDHCGKNKDTGQKFTS